jgi:hypothetical protein
MAPGVQLFLPWERCAHIQVFLIKSHHISVIILFLLVVPTMCLIVCYIQVSNECNIQEKWMLHLV